MNGTGLKLIFNQILTGVEIHWL